MAEVTYVLCAITSLLSASLLARAAFGRGGRLMFWGAVFFAGMALNNVLLFVDVMVGPEYDWSLAPNLVALASVALLIYGLVWESA